MKALYSLIIVLLVMILASCSNGSNPVTPENAIDSAPLFISETKDQSGMASNPYRGVFGAWKVRLDVKNMTAEVIPVRNAKTRNALAIGDIFDADLSQFLTVNPCSNCLWIPYLYQAADENIIIGIRMKHPFANLAARPDLHGFDVRAIFIGHTWCWEGDGINIIKPDGTVETSQMGSLFLLNPDGFTSHYDELVNDERYFIGGSDVDGNLNGFLRFFENYTTPPFDPHNPVGQNVIAVGAGDYTRDAVIDDFALGDIIEFYVIADVAYGQSAVFSNRPDPQYYLPAFHRTESWRVEYFLENNNLKKSDITSTAELVVQVFDWQHGAAVDPAYPDPGNLSGIPESSNVSQVELVIPTMFDYAMIETIPESGTGIPSDPLQYRFTITNELGNFNSIHNGAIAVRDELHGSVSPSGRVPIPVTPAGFPYETLDIRDYSLYQRLYINVPLGGWIPDEYGNELLVNGESQYDQLLGDVNINADFFMDHSHKKYQYRWDYDFDGVTFDIDGSGLPSPEIPLQPGITDLGLRVRTNTVPPQEHVYSIPAYGGGTAWDDGIESGGNWNASSEQRSHSAAMTDDYVYSVYTHVSSGVWCIMLAVGNKRTGEFNRYEVANTSGINYSSPVIAVVEDGVNDGVYVAFAGFETMLGSGIYSNKGNLDGTGFSNANIKIINGPVVLTGNGWPVIVYDPDTYFLHVYYSYSNIIFETSINAAHSEDLGETWNTDGRIHNVANISQHHPTAVYSDHYANGMFYVVWEDWSDLVNRGRDLWIGWSSDGISFPNPQIITASPGEIHETYPNMACYEDQIAIAYNHEPIGWGRRDVHVLFTNNNLDYVFDYEATMGTNFDYSRPAIAMDSKGIATVAYGEYEIATQDLELLVYKLKNEMQMGDISRWEIKSECLGTMPNQTAMEIYPAIASSRLLNGHVTDRFVTWQSYNNGSSEILFRWFGTQYGLYNVHSGEYGK